MGDLKLPFTFIEEIAKIIQKYTLLIKFNKIWYKLNKEKKKNAPTQDV